MPKSIPIDIPMAKLSLSSDIPIAVPIICIDLDNVSENKKALVDDFSETYIEISQSGKGLHIFTKGSIKKNFNNQIEKVEMYNENRCIAMTGELFTVNYLAENKQDAIDKYRYIHPKKVFIKP